MYITDLHDSSNDSEICVKVVIVGNGAVGKSSMIQRYCKGVFTKGYKKTIGVDFLEKRLRVFSENVRLMLWDTAGQEEFDAITKAYYRGAQACVVAFSTTDRASLEAARKWKKKVEDEVGSDSMPMVLVQNKVDLMADSQVTDSEVRALAKDLRMRLYQTSAKENLNVANVFLHLAENYVNQVKSMSLLTIPPPRIGGERSEKENEKQSLTMTPSEYLSNPMFESLPTSNRRAIKISNPWSNNNHSNSSSSNQLNNFNRGFGTATTNNQTIVLRPLSHIKKKQRSLSMRLKPDVAKANACKVL